MLLYDSLSTCITNNINSWHFTFLNVLSFFYCKSPLKIHTVKWRRVSQVRPRLVLGHCLNLSVEGYVCTCESEAIKLIELFWKVQSEKTKSFEKGTLVQKSLQVWLNVRFTHTVYTNGCIKKWSCNTDVNTMIWMDKHVPSDDIKMQ